MSAVTVGGCRELACWVLSITNIAASPAVAKTSTALASSRSSGPARPLGYLRVTPTWRESADPVTPCPPTGGGGLPLVTTGGGWSWTRPPLSTPIRIILDLYRNCLFTTPILLNWSPMLNYHTTIEAYSSLPNFRLTLTAGARSLLYRKDPRHFSESNSVQCIHRTLIIQAHYLVKQLL